MRKSDFTTLETVACPLCDGKDAEPWVQCVDTSALRNDTTWHLQRCKSCSLIFLNPRPTEIASSAFYDQAEYLPFSSAADQQSFLSRVYAAARRYNLKWKRKAVSKNHRRGRLLDVGCGTGEFLQEMRQAGWEVGGIERDSSAAQFASKQLHLKVITGGVEALDRLHEKFEVITLWHVLEHLYQPKPALQKLKSMLSDDGVLIIAVPNIGGIDAKIYGEHWVALDAPRHVQHFTLNTLREMATAVGLKLLRSQQLPLDAFFNTLMSERRKAAITHSSFLLWPLRIARSFFIAVSSLLAGSRMASGGARGATIVACFVKSKNYAKN